MSIYKVIHTSSDTCGNTWSDDKDTQYWRADSLEHAWMRLGSPKVTTYFIDGKAVDRARTPKGKGYGIWETNPDFNWERDAKKATSFTVAGFTGLRVSKLQVF